MTVPEDVPVVSSTTPEDDPTPPVVPVDVTTDVTEPVIEDRPLKNLQAEFNRKFSRVEQQYADLATMLQQALQPKPPTPPASTLEQYTNEQLAQLAQAGSAEAHQELTKRMVQIQVNASTAQQQYVARVQGEHQTLYKRYPVLNDPTHPLTQYAMQAKAALLRQGAPNNVATDVEAIKTAIVDNAGNSAIIGSPQTLEEPVRRAGVQAQSQIDGAPVRRQQPAAPAGKTKLSEKEWALAKRMGVKDPEGAKARFEKRQAEGRSNLGAVGLHVRES